MSYTTFSGNTHKDNGGVEPIRDANGKTPGEIWREKQEAEAAERQAHREALEAKYAPARESREQAKTDQVAAFRQAQEDRAKAQAAELERREKNLARHRWLAQGGDPDQFELSWPGLWRRMQEQRFFSGGEFRRPLSSF